MTRISKKFKVLSLLGLLLVTPFLQAKIQREGKWYGYWGWNRSSYAPSTIDFQGEGHDFTLYDVKATDRQNELTLKEIFGTYLHPLRITIPQYNLRFGYFIKDNIAVSLGWDHMKYVMTNGQTVEMDGTIDSSVSELHQISQSDGVINKELSKDFLRFEHTDGFNTLTLEGEYYHSLYQKNSTMDFSLLGGSGAGLVIPRSAVAFVNKEIHDEWHLAGVAINAKAGFEFTAYSNFFYRMTVKTGYANMFDVITTHDGGRAQQGIGYIQYMGAFGYRF